MTAFRIIEAKIRAARPIAGAVLRCAGSARIWRLGTSGSWTNDLRAQMIVSQNPDADPAESAAAADRRFAGIRDRSPKNFRTCFAFARPAARPESRTAASGENQTVACDAIYCCDGMSTPRTSLKRAIPARLAEKVREQIDEMIGGVIHQVGCRGRRTRKSAAAFR